MSAALLESALRVLLAHRHQRREQTRALIVADIALLREVRKA